MPASHPMYTPSTASEVRVQRLALLMATVFLVIAVLGFVPGRHSGAVLFGASVLHDLTHLASAIVGFVMARSIRGARSYLIGGGVGYLGLNAFGLVLVTHGTDTIDLWLHLVLGATMVAAGVLTSRSADTDWRFGAGEGARTPPDQH